MLRSILKHSWKVIPVILLAGILIALPGYVERQVNQRLRAADIAELLSETVKARTGLSLRIEGSRFHIYHGLIFSGVTLAGVSLDEAPPVILKAEHLVLNISYYDLWKGRFPLKRAIIKDARVYPWSLTGEEWSAVIEKLNAVPESSGRNDEIAVRIQEGLFSGTEFEFTDFDIQFPPDILLTIHDRTETPQLLMDLYTVPSDGGVQIRFKGAFGIRHHLAGKINGNGFWKSEAEKNLEVSYERISAPVIFQLLHRFSYPEDFMMLPETTVKEGLMSGTGSLLITGDTASVKTAGTFEDLDTETEFDNIPLLFINNGAGSFQVSADFDRQSDSVRNLTFRLEEPHFRISTVYSADSDNRNFSTESEFRFNKKEEGRSDRQNATLSLMGLPAEGNVFINYSLKTPLKIKNPPIKPVFEMRTDGFHLMPPADLLTTSGFYKETGIPAGITVQSGSIRLADNGTSVTEAKGTFFGAEASLSGKGQIILSREQFRDTNEIIIKRNYSFEGSVDRMQYSDLVSVLLWIPVSVYRKGTDTKAVISEDMGPVWTNRFINTKLYRQVIFPFNFTANLKFQNLKGGESVLPPDLSVSLSKKDNQFQVSIPRTATAASEIMLRYRILFEAALPGHDGEFLFSSAPNVLPLPEFFGNASVPDSLKVRFTYGGHGLLPGDLVNRSFSSFSMEAENADLREFDGGKLASFHFGLPPEKLKARSLKWNRVTDGITETYNQILADLGEMTAAGNGTFDPVKGGNVFFTVRKPEDPAYLKSIGFRIRPDRRWVSSDMQ